MLYERDFRILSADEIKTWKKARGKFTKSRKNGVVTPRDIVKYHDSIPSAILHYESLFPNNYLNPQLLNEPKKLKKIKKLFKELLDKKSRERDIINFIRDNKAYFIIASILKSHFTFGHHGAFLFSEFGFPPNHKIDYLLAGKNSGGYEFVFVELESCNGQTTTKEGEFGSAIRKGIKQVGDWNMWLDSNYSHLRLEFSKHLGSVEKLPDEFFQLDKSRIHFVVLSGRRNHFKQKTYHLKRKLKKESNILLLHYDNLVDCVNLLLKTYEF